MLKDTIKKCREEKRLTQEELAEKIHVSRSLIAKWEQGRGVPSAEDFESLCSVLDIKLEDVVPYSTVVEQSKSNKKKRNIIISLVAIILFLVIVWVVVDNVDRTDFKRDLYVYDYNLGSWVYDDSTHGNPAAYVNGSMGMLRSKHIDEIEAAIVACPYYRGKIVYKKNRINYGERLRKFVDHECYVLSKEGHDTLLLIRVDDALYIHDFEGNEGAALIGDLIPGKLDKFEEPCYYLARITQDIIKANKSKYYCGEEYEPAYTIEEMHLLYANSEIDESGTILTLYDVVRIGFAFVDNIFDIKIHYLDNGNITFELIVRK